MRIDLTNPAVGSIEVEGRAMPPGWTGLWVEAPNREQSPRVLVSYPAGFELEGFADVVVATGSAKAAALEMISKLDPNKVEELAVVMLSACDEGGETVTLGDAVVRAVVELLGEG